MRLLAQAAIAGAAAYVLVSIFANSPTPTSPAAQAVAVQPPAAQASAQASLSPQAQFCLGELDRVNNITRNASDISSASHALAGMRAIYAECRAFPKFEEEISASIEGMSRGLDALVKTCMENPSIVEQCR